MKKVLLPVWLCMAFSGLVSGQAGSMSVEDAIALGLKNNFNIQIAANDSRVATNNNTAGNAGFLPKVNVSGGLKESVINTTTESTSNTTTTSNDQRTDNASLAVTLDWTLFNGFDMFIRKEKLGSLQNLQETATRATIENTISEIITAYFTVVQLRNSLQVLQNAVDFSNSRYELTRKKLQIGSASELSFLKSSTDLNADSAAYLRQKVALSNARSKLSNLLVLDPASEYEVTSEIIFDNILDYSTLKQNIEQVNSQVSLARQAVDISMLDYRLTHSPKYPQVSLFADYNFSSSKYNYGSSSTVQNAGPVAGVNLSLPVFDGLNKRRVSANAKLNLESTKLEYQQVVKNTETSLLQVYNDYRNNLKLVTLETANLEVARHTTKISFERFRVGDMSDYELRQIQLSELEAENSLIVARFLAKKSETELLRLSGKLIAYKKAD